MNILIVDDNEDARTYLARHLRAEGYTVVTAQNGIDALDKAWQSPPDLVISDILMPEMDGFQLCRNWKADDRLAFIPFVFYTATYTDARDEKLALDLGADRFIIKPQEPEVMIEILKDVLDERDRGKLTASEGRDEDMELLRQYNAVLFAKLQKKLGQLESEIAEHKRTESTLRGSEMRFRRLFETSQDGILILDGSSGHITEVNPYLLRLLGYSRDEVLQKKLWEIGAFKDAAAIKEAFAELQRTGYARYADLPLETKEGVSIAVEFVSNTYGIDHTQVIQCNIRDITDRKRTEAALLESEEKFKVLFNDSTDGLLLVNKKTGRFILWNKSICQMLGYTDEEMRNLSVDDIHSKEDLARVRDVFEKIERGDLTLVSDLPVKKKDGSIFHADINASALKMNGDLYLMGSFRDVTARKQAEQELNTLNQALEKRSAELARTNAELDVTARQLRSVNERLEQLAMVDPLTQLLNRRGLENVLTQEIHRAMREETSCFALLIDLDDFKQINDTLGMTVGDMALTQIAAQLRASLRATDHACRIGGDEFLVLLPATSAIQAILIAEKLRLAIAWTPPLDPLATNATVTASLALVEISTATTSIEELITRAQLTLRQSKAAGKNRASYSEDVVGRSGTDTHDMWSQLLTTLRRGDGIHVVRQPIYSLQNMRVVGYEALSRLAFDEFEMPNDFFHISVQANMLTLVDHHCFRACLAAASSFPPETRWHLNIFPSTLVNIPVQDMLAAIPVQRRSGTYCLEISEQQVLGNWSNLMEVVRTLKQAGVLIAMDDVGFGRSSLESLILLQPHIVKIDKSWVQGVAQDSARAQTIRTTLQVIRAIGAEAVAEGIELSEDLDTLRTLGVEYGQGFLLGRPTEAEGFPLG